MRFSKKLHASSRVFLFLTDFRNTFSIQYTDINPKHIGLRHVQMIEKLPFNVMCPKPSILPMSCFFQKVDSKKNVC